MATKTSQRVAIIIIAVVMLVGTVGFYFLSILTTNEQQEQSKQQQEMMEAYQKQITCVDNNPEEVLPIPEVITVEAKTTALQKTDLIAGEGAELKTGDCAIVKYYGTLATTGAVFDENFSTAKGFAFLIGQQMVIKGWDDGLVGMKVGGTRRIVVPSDQGYKAAAQEKIPANSDLIFSVKLLRIQ